MDDELNNSTAATSEYRFVVCPHCKGESVYHVSNAARPFCSPRCKAMDLGAWASEDFRVAAVNSTDPSSADEI